MELGCDSSTIPGFIPRSVSDLQQKQITQTKSLYRNQANNLEDDYKDQQKYSVIAGLVPASA